LINRLKNGKRNQLIAELEGLGMRAATGLFVATTVAATSALCQDNLTVQFDGRAGSGRLSQETIDAFGRGFDYGGSVFRLEGIGRLEFAASENFRIGAVARLMFQKGQDPNYGRLIDFAPRGQAHEFDANELDLAAYVAASGVTLSYGEMESAFDFATLEIPQGNSIIDGGNAAWLNLGSAEGSLGYSGAVDTGQWNPDFRTLRGDVSLGEFLFSASTSRGTSFFGQPLKVDAAGIVWQREGEQGSVRIGAGWDRGPEFDFRSFSFGLRVEGLNFVVSKIHRDPLVISSGITAAYDTTFTGFSLSYDFGDWTVGLARSSQKVNPRGDQVFAGKAKALWVSWDARENVSVDFELSESDYRVQSGRDTHKASLAVALEF
jgi:hypothetical protein